MANYGSTSTRTNFQGNLKLTGGTGGVRVQYCFYENRFYGGDLYWHYKTSILHSGWAMYNIEAVGYNYGNSLPIRCNWAFHVSYNNGIYNTYLTNSYSGLTANRIYNSSDGRIVIVANSNTAYYAGWSFNAYTVNAIPAGGEEISMLAAVQTSSNSNYY